MLLFILTAFFKVFAGTDSLYIFDQSYPRDNTFCSYGNKRLEVMIRGSTKHTDASDLGYGESVFYKINGKKPEMFDFSKNHSDTFHFFKADKSLCSDSHGYLIGEQTIALLLLKENRPFKDHLVVQFFDFSRMRPGKFIETELPVVKARSAKSGFLVKVWEESHGPAFGKVTIEGETFIFNEQVFPKWMAYMGGEFQVNPDETYNDFPWKKSFKNQEDFNLLTQWDKDKKKYLKDVFYVAVNHKIGKQCFLFLEKKQTLTGAELWRCQTI